MKRSIGIKIVWLKLDYSKTIHKNYGFTLIEMMIMIALIDIPAPSPSDEEFGTERLAALLEARGEPLEVSRRIYRAVRAHQATNLFEDDLTFMVVERAICL